MIVSVAADKGCPGVTELATALALSWSTPRLLLEADPSGADLPFRLRHADGDRLLDAQPSLLSLAADARRVLAADALARYAQPTSLGLSVVPGALSSEAFATVARLWASVALAAAAYDGTVVADLGRLQPGALTMPIAAASAVVVLLARPDLAGLYRLRDRVAALTHELGDPAATPGRIAIAVRARPGREGRSALEQVEQVLRAAGSGAPVLGLFAEDPAGIAALRTGNLSRQLLGSELLRSARHLADQLRTAWPALLPGQTTPPADSTRTPAPAATRRLLGRLPARPAATRSGDSGDVPVRQATP